jgi:hypothetical protein
MPLSGGVNPQQHGQPAWQNMPGKPLGVGIVFQPDSTGALHVKALAAGGPAERCGLVNVGDVLHEIDGHHVYRKPVAALAPLILGQEGTVVKLGLQRGTLQRLVYVRSPPSSSPLICLGSAWPGELTHAGAQKCIFSILHYTHLTCSVLNPGGIAAFNERECTTCACECEPCGSQAVHACAAGR